jgi:hypothetical protein
MHAKGGGHQRAEEEGVGLLTVHMGALFMCCFALFLFI